MGGSVVIWVEYFELLKKIWIWKNGGRGEIL